MKPIKSEQKYQDSSVINQLRAGLFGPLIVDYSIDLFELDLILLKFFCWECIFFDDWLLNTHHNEEYSLFGLFQINRCCNFGEIQILRQ